jgi:HEAT repeat protein
MKLFRLILTVVFVCICFGCQQAIDPSLLEEETADQESELAEVPQPKSMVRVHKSEPEVDGKVLDRLLAECKSDSVETRKAAAVALGEIGPAAIPALTELLRDKDLGVRLAASSTLKKIKDVYK